MILDQGPKVRELERGDRAELEEIDRVSTGSCENFRMLNVDPFRVTSVPRVRLFRSRPASWRRGSAGRSRCASRRSGPAERCYLFSSISPL